MDSRIALWIADASGSDFRWIERQGVSAEATWLSVLLSNPDSPIEAIRRLSRHLHEQLLGSVAARIASAATLIIDADAVLAQVPWTMLENSAGQPLIERHALLLSHGWYEAASRIAPGRLKLRPALIVTDPELDLSAAQRLPPLRDARDEGSALCSRLVDARLITGGEARLDIVRTLLPNQRLLHYAGHGLTNGGFGALALAKEPGFPVRMFTAQQIANLDLSSLELVVMAACSSGIGERTGMLDLTSLVRAFLEAGANRVVAARWNIASRPTAALMRDFYTSLLSGTGPAEALRAAALAVRSQPLTAHPYYWAAFEIYGGL